MGVCGFDNDDMWILLLWDNESDMEFGRRCRGYATKQPNRDMAGWSGMSGGNTVGGWKHVSRQERERNCCSRAQDDQAAQRGDPQAQRAWAKGSVCGMQARERA